MQGASAATPWLCMGPSPRIRPPLQPAPPRPRPGPRVPIGTLGPLLFTPAAFPTLAQSLTLARRVVLISEPKLRVPWAVGPLRLTSAMASGCLRFAQPRWKEGCGHLPAAATSPLRRLTRQSYATNQRPHGRAQRGSSRSSRAPRIPLSFPNGVPLGCPGLSATISTRG